MFPPKYFDISPEGECSGGLDAFRFLFKPVWEAPVQHAERRYQLSYLIMLGPVSNPLSPLPPIESSPPQKHFWAEMGIKTLSNLGGTFFFFLKIPPAYLRVNPGGDLFSQKKTPAPEGNTEKSASFWRISYEHRPVGPVMRRCVNEG